MARGKQRKTSGVTVAGLCPIEEFKDVLWGVDVEWGDAPAAARPVLPTDASRELIHAVGATLAGIDWAGKNNALIARELGKSVEWVKYWRPVSIPCPKLTNAQRTEIANKANSHWTSAQRSEAARLANAARTPEQRSEIARKRILALTPEQRGEAVRKGREGALKTNALRAFKKITP